MAFKFLAWIAIISISAPTTAQSGKEALVLKPTSAWHIDYADDRCRLARQFGEKEEQVLAFFDRYGPSEFFRLTLAGKPVRALSDRANAAVQFGPNEQEQQLHFFSGNTGKMPALIFSDRARIAPPTAEETVTAQNAKLGGQFEFSPVSEARQKAVKYLQIGKPLRRAVMLETGSMRKPLEALDKCIVNLMTHWGIDVEKHRNLTREAEPADSPGRWVVSMDYPMDMLRAGQPAIVEFRLSVGADGKPTACHIQSTTRPKEFDDAVCKSVMRRARFDPALDAEGKPLASYYRNTVRFQIP